MEPNDIHKKDFRSKKDFSLKIKIINKKQDVKKKGEYISQNEKELLNAQRQMFERFGA